MIKISSKLRALAAWTRDELGGWAESRGATLAPCGAAALWFTAPAAGDWGERYVTADRSEVLAAEKELHQVQLTGALTSTTNKLIHGRKKKQKKKQVPREGATMHQVDTAAVSIKVHKRIQHWTLFKGFAQEVLCVCVCLWLCDSVRYNLDLDTVQVGSHHSGLRC